MEKKRPARLELTDIELASPVERKPNVAALAAEDASRFMARMAAGVGDLPVGYGVPAGVCSGHADQRIAEGRLLPTDEEDYIIAFRDYCSGGTARRDN